MVMVSRRKQIKAHCAVFEYQEIIKLAGANFQVSPSLIAAILCDEITRRNFLDDVQDVLARRVILGGWKSKNLLIKLWRFFSNEELYTQSFGLPQMNPETVSSLISAGYIKIDERRGFENLEFLLSVILDENQSPNLIAARLRQTIDHWKAGGVDISQRDGVLATLYSIGITGERGVHPDVQANARGEKVARSALEFSNIYNFS